MGGRAGVYACVCVYRGIDKGRDICACARHMHTHVQRHEKLVTETQRLRARERGDTAREDGEKREGRATETHSMPTEMHSRRGHLTRTLLHLAVLQELLRQLRAWRCLQVYVQGRQAKSVHGSKSAIKADSEQARSRQTLSQAVLSSREMGLDTRKSKRQ